MTEAPISDRAIFAIAERVVRAGAYARFTAAEQLALCRWVLEQRPDEPGSFVVTIRASSDFEQLAPETQAAVQALMERAREAAEAILSAPAEDPEKPL